MNIYQNPMLQQQQMQNYLQRTNTYQPTHYPQNNGINWVQGIEGAKAWQLEPNSNVVLLDSESDGIFYIKVSDNIGMCSLRLFRFEEINEQPKQSDIDMSNFVTRDELETLIATMGLNSNPIQQEVNNDGEQTVSANGKRANKVITK